MKLGKSLNGILILIFVNLRRGKGSEEVFSFALIADAHLTGNEDHYRRLVAAVSYINSKYVEEGLEFVITLGDTAYGSTELVELSKVELDKLEIPYFPIIGDDPIQGGQEETFERVFRAHFEKVSELSEVEEWEKAPLPVRDPNTGEDLYLQNYAFYYKGVRFILTDWNTRVITKELAGNQAHLYDFPGGTFPFFTAQVAKSKRVNNGILIFSHQPLHVSFAYPLYKKDEGAFSPREYAQIADFTIRYKDYLAINFAGHYHVPFRQYMLQGGYQFIAVSSLHPPYEIFIYKYRWIFYEPRIMFVKVIKDGDGFKYRTRTIVVPYDH